MQSNGKIQTSINRKNRPVKPLKQKNKQRKQGRTDKRGKKLENRRENGSGQAGKAKMTGFLFLVLKIELALLVTVFLSAVGVFTGIVVAYIQTTNEVSQDLLNMRCTPAVVYDAAGNQYGTVYNGARIWANYDEIPRNLINAFVAVEDERFWEHRGVDFIRVAGVTYKLFIRGYVVGGASTITQQVVKMTTGEDDFTLRRKIQEQWKALQIEKVAGKKQILELYLNLVYLGEGVNGVKAAARTFFDKNLSELTLAECASIAATARRPTTTEPLNNKEYNKSIRDIVLSKMLELKYITKEEYDEAVNQDVAASRGIIEPPSVMPHFVEETLREVQADLKEKLGMTDKDAWSLIENGGLRIYSTIDPAIQGIVDGAFMDEDGYFPHYSTDIIDNERPQGAMIVIDPSTGAIKAMSGGSGEKTANFVKNLATQEKRQPGSTIKPMGVYAPLIELGRITAATVFEDLPLHLPDGYHPHNYSYNYRGLTTVRDAIINSTNVVAVKAWLMLGPDLSHYFLTNSLGLTGIRTDPNDPVNDRNAAMALGGLTDGVTLLEMTSSYIPLANQGIYTKPYMYTRVEQPDGTVILEKQVEARQVISSQTAYIMTAMLKDVVERGTAGPAILNEGEIDSAGKTGTSSGYRDRWFIGYSPYYLAGVWYGFYPQRFEFPGEGQALRIYADVMRRIHENLPARSFEKPEGIVVREVCIDSGKLPGPYCEYDPRGSRVREEIFATGTEPTETCDTHALVKICTESGGLAGESCPDWSVRQVVGIRRHEHHDATPCTEDIPCAPGTTLDKWVEMPSWYCDVH